MRLLIKNNKDVRVKLYNSGVEHNSCKIRSKFYKLVTSPNYCITMPNCVWAMLILY